MNSQEVQWLLKEKYSGEKTEGFFADCKRLAEGEPLGYLIGHIPFLDCTIHLEERPLIPRPETEFWTEQVISSITHTHNLQPTLTTESTEIESSTILDLCAGSGCIGIAIATSIEHIQVDFSEIDARLIPTIEKNIRANISTPERCQTYHSNLFSGLPHNKRYSFIVTNPPYIDPALNRVDDSVHDFEPHLALFGGEQGLTVIEEIIRQAPEYLAPQGQLWIEHEPEQSNTITALASQHGFTSTNHTDQYNVIRFSILVLK